MHVSDRLQRLDHLLSELVASWHGMLILAGDVNIDMIKQQTSDVKRYSEILESLNLKQVVAKATRTTKSSKTLVDDVITNLPKRVTNTDVLPRTLDHDASLSRGIQFSRASLNGALTQHKNKDIKTRQLIKLQRQHVPQALLFKMAL